MRAGKAWADPSEFSYVQPLEGWLIASYWRAQQTFLICWMLHWTDSKVGKKRVLIAGTSLSSWYLHCSVIHWVLNRTCKSNHQICILWTALMYYLFEAYKMILNSNMHYCNSSTFLCFSLTILSKLNISKQHVFSTLIHMCLWNCIIPLVAA